MSQNAYSGTITREKFAKVILRYEFEATTNTRSILLALKFGTNEIADSDYYRRFIECPTNFNGFQKYSKKTSHDRDVMREYELKYDSLRKMYFDSNSTSNSPAKN